MPECSGAPKVSKPASESSRLITASWAKLPPAPPYSSGIEAQSSPAAPDLVQTSRSYMPFSCQRSIWGSEFVGDEAPRLLFEQDEVLGHPLRPRKIEGIHVMIPDARRTLARAPARREGGNPYQPAPSATATL